ncbi:MAG: phosphatidate cytidylyltransferase [Cyclobacteriaceae bacterium]|nr:phosphatidate cytidylyltransferase [Cyclobacteriaceae bacterium]
MKSSLNKYNNLTQRVISGLIGATAIIGSAYLGEWFFLVVFLSICMFTIWEFYNLVGLDGMIPLKTFGSLSGGFIFLMFFLVERGTLSDKFFFLIFPLVSGIYLIKLYRKSDTKPFANIAITFLGILYVALPISLFNLAAFHLGRGTYSYEIIIGIMVILWASDSGAYFAGIKFGKRKLFERISPKKSWEGSIGGAITAIAAGFCLSHYFHVLTPVQWLVVSIIIIISGTYGDLVESLFKRSIAIKDSGSIIPGHGGFLDRFDSLLLSMPFIVAYIEII